METINLDGFTNLEKSLGMGGLPEGSKRKWKDGKTYIKKNGKWELFKEEGKKIDNENFFDIKDLKPSHISPTSTFFKNMKVGDYIQYDDGEGFKFEGMLMGFNAFDQKGRLAFVSVGDDTYTTIDALINGGGIKKVTHLH
jgi:hypothetical protein